MRRTSKESKIILKRSVKQKALLIVLCLSLGIFAIGGCGQKNSDGTSAFKESTSEWTTPEEEYFELPERYDNRDYGKTATVKNQGSTQSCWAFASAAALEAALLPEEEHVFSAINMMENSGFGLTNEEGGDYVMVMAYLARWAGPVELDSISTGKSTTAKHVQEMQILDSKDYDSIKRAVMLYGAVEGTIYFAENEDQIDENYYNKYENSYCYPYEASPNHQILIVGWDDNYSREKFFTGATEDGAFICQNSWGEDFGEGGFFYVSYNDYLIGTYNLAFTNIEDSDNYDNIYQYDMCGWVGRMGFDSPKAYFANVFESGGAESVEAVSFYALGENTLYKVYVCEDFADTGSLDVRKEPCVSGHVNNKGYYTVKLDEPVQIDVGKKFAIIVEIESPGETHPVAIEMMAGDERSSMVTIEGKESYLSSNGTNWENTQWVSECNVCLKCFTNNIQGQNR